MGYVPLPMRATGESRVASRRLGRFARPSRFGETIELRERPESLSLPNRRGNAAGGPDQ